MADESYVEEIFGLVGEASRCWEEDGGKGVFDEEHAIEIANRLCEIVREQVADETPADVGFIHRED